MQALGVTAVEVNEQLRALNLDAAGGRAQVGGGEQAIRVLGGAKSAAALGDTQLILPGGKSVRLSEIADVRDSIEEVRNIARLNGRPATTFGVFKAKGASDVSVARAVDAELDKIKAENPAVHMSTIFTSVDHTLRTYHSAISALIEGSLLAVAVVWLFLRNARATMISALAIPLSAIPTFAFMQWMGFTLNQISLLGLSLVAGVLVDDAIVEIENIVRHMRMGKSCFQAAIDAADEIGLAVVATSFTIIAVFLPVSFMGGVSGQYFKQFGLTVAAAVFISLMVARLITPVLAAYALSSDSLVVHNTDGPIMTRYLSTAALVRRKPVEDHRRRHRILRPVAVGVRTRHHSDRLRAARGFFERGAADRTAARRPARGHRAGVGRGGASAAEIARGDRRRRIRRRRRRRDSQRHHLCQPGAAHRAQPQPEAMGAENDAPAQSGRRRAAELLRRRRRARHPAVSDRR
jgi:multidrug efflux pump subunit AcrB